MTQVEDVHLEFTKAFVERLGETVVLSGAFNSDPLKANAEFREIYSENELLSGVSAAELGCLWRKALPASYCCIRGSGRVLRRKALFFSGSKRIFH
jgi:hypothetical protein